MKIQGLSSEGSNAVFCCCCYLIFYYICNHSVPLASPSSMLKVLFRKYFAMFTKYLWCSLACSGKLLWSALRSISHLVLILYYVSFSQMFFDYCSFWALAGSVCILVPLQFRAHPEWAFGEQIISLARTTIPNVNLWAYHESGDNLQSQLHRSVCHSRWLVIPKYISTALFYQGWLIMCIPLSMFAVRCSHWITIFSSSFLLQMLEHWGTRCFLLRVDLGLGLFYNSHLLHIKSLIRSTVNKITAG